MAYNNLSGAERYKFPKIMFNPCYICSPGKKIAAYFFIWSHKKPTTTHRRRIKSCFQ
ncbi:hypothetical protein BD408DRAFT_424876 [Parasitella parasitica]|nr:hypothetical protein BD408DRAFT_424876 [Parasitella parasitica]